MSKQVSINIRPGVRLPHTIEGIDIVSDTMLVDLTTKQRLMTLRPGLFLANDPDWPKKVAEVGVREEAPAVKAESKSKKSDDSNPT